MNETKVEGLYDEAKGKVKQGFGEATGNSSVANSGVTDQVKGHAEETWGNVKDAAHDTTRSSTVDRAEHDVEHTGHNVREGIAHAAESVKDSVERGIDHLKHAVKD